MSADRSTRPRGSSPPDTPAFSVVVTSREDPEALRSLLAGLLPLCAAHGVQAVVVRAGPVEEALALADEHPGARFLHPADGGAPDAALRSAGMAAADGDVVLFGSDRDPSLPARLLHLLRSQGVSAPRAEDPLPARPRPDGDALQGTDDGASPASRQDLNSREIPEPHACNRRPQQHPAAWTASPSATASSSSAPAPAG
ncbi:MAG: hypothetical protein AB1941_28200 [Gemmatimonadota bacterium]